MSFKEALDAEIAASTKGPRCSVGKLVDTLDPDDWQALCESLDTPAIETAKIARALARGGHSITALTVGRHRKHECRCE